MKCRHDSCENELIGKQRTYCSDRCRKAESRATKSDKSVTQAGRVSELEPSRTSLERCRYCNVPLPPLAKPRRWPGACNDCAVRQPRKPSIKALGELVYAGSEYVPPSKSESRSRIIWESEPGAAKAIDERLTS